MTGALRQLLHPAPFRITAPEWPRDIAALLSLAADSAGAEESRPSAAAVCPPESCAKEEHDRSEGLPSGTLVDLGTGLWRLRQRMIDPSTGEPADGMRKAYRHFMSIWDALESAGVEIQDHTDQLFDAGHSLKVVEFQPTPGIHNEKVIETIRPSIYYHGERVQIGEVIVGTPA